MRTKTLILSICVLFTGLLNAQTTAKQLLDKAKDQLATEESLQFDYTLTLDFPDQDPIVKMGTVRKKGKQYHATLDDRWFKSDGQTQWIYDPDMNEVQIYDAGESNALPVSPDALSDFYESEDYQYDITGKDEMKGKEVTYIEFKSLDPESEYVKMRLALYSKDAKPIYFMVFGRNGSRYTLAIDEMKTHVTFEKNEFTFDKSKYPDVHVEDLRM